MIFSSASTLACLDKYTFSHDAAEIVRADHSNLFLQHQPNINKVFGAIEQGDLGLVPLENSGSGLVVPHIDWLLSHPARIIGDVHLTLEMCVGGLVGANSKDAKHVFGHQQSIKQCSAYLSVLSDAEMHEMASNVVGIEAVSQAQSPESVALASRRAILAAGLEVLDVDVGNLKEGRNVTQFYVVQKHGHADLPNAEKTYHSLYLIPKNERGIIAQITSHIASAADLTSLHSRPLGPKEYGFFIEMKRETSAREMKKMASSLEKTGSVRWLGSWDDRWEV